jgi:hypothetical protein
MKRNKGKWRIERKMAVIVKKKKSVKESKIRKEIKCKKSNVRIREKERSE